MREPLIYIYIYNTCNSGESQTWNIVRLNEFSLDGTYLNLYLIVVLKKKKKDVE